MATSGSSLLVMKSSTGDTPARNFSVLTAIVDAACFTPRGVRGFAAYAHRTITYRGTEIVGRPVLAVYSPFGAGSPSAIRCTRGASGDFAERCLRSKATWRKVSTTSLFD
jgi:hypothetical protein